MSLLNNKDFLCDLVLNRSNFKNLAGKSIFITGSTGFLGKWILHALAFINNKNNLDLKLYLLVRDKKKIIELIKNIKNAHKIFIKIIVGDVRSFNFPSNKIDHIIHLASESLKRSIKNEKNTLSVTINGTRRVIALSNLCNTTSLTYLSSGAVYGKNCPYLSGWSEKDLTINSNNTSNNSYANAKIIAEQYLIKEFSNSNNLKTLNILRAFSFGGSGFNKKNNYAFDSFIQNRISNENIKVLSNGKNKRNFMHPLDLSNWILKGLELKGSRVINTGSNQNHTINRLAKNIADFSYKDLSKVSVELGDIDHRENYIPNLCEAKKLGFKAYITLKMQIEESLVFYYNNKCYDQ
tara:strand:- start:269 stop:1321 length:1053 start_codon:yes stop_codon:yes gene_type:complete